MRGLRCMWEWMCLGIGGGEEARGGDDVELNREMVGWVYRPDWRSIGKREAVGCLEAISNR